MVADSHPPPEVRSQRHLHEMPSIPWSGTAPPENVQDSAELSFDPMLDPQGYGRTHRRPLNQLFMGRFGVGAGWAPRHSLWVAAGVVIEAPDPSPPRPPAPRDRRPAQMKSVSPSVRCIDVPRSPRKDSSSALIETVR